MKLQKTPIALAVALAAAVPFAAEAAPSVSFTSPQDGATVSKVSTYVCAATASGASSVSFALISSTGAVKALNTDSSSPYNCYFNSWHYADGNWTLRAIARDASGATATATRQITINNNGTTTGGTTNAAPVVSFLKPATGTSVVAGNTVACEVTASDADGIAKVEWFLNGALKATETASPYNFCNVGALAAGTHTITARATDKKGLSSEANVTVSATSTTGGGTTTNTPPVVTFVKPATGTSVVEGNTVACEVTASDADGIAKVEWFLDGVLKATETSAPYNFCNVGALSAGPRVIKARATDKKGLSAENQVSVNVTKTSTSGGTAPTAQFVAPAAGATIKGDATGAVAGLPACGVSGTNIAKVDFYMNDVKTNYDMNGSNGWGCYFNTNNYTPGTHTLKAVVSNSAGESVTISQPVVIAGSTPPTNAAPTVSITAPASNGATLTGPVSCAANAADTDGSIAGVQFSLINASGTKIDLQNDTASPYDCSFDSKTYPNGNYTLQAEATDNTGAKTSDSRTVTISNLSSDNTTGNGSVDSGDILTKASADTAFSTQPNIYTDILGSTIWMSAVPEDGKHGTLLPNGETLRFGKEADPVNAARKALTFQLVSSDPNTGGSKRVELGYPRQIEMNKTYWIAVSILVEDWGTLSASDLSLFGFQLHSGTKLDLSPTITLQTTKDGRSFLVSVRHSTSTSPSQSNTVKNYYAEQPIPFGRWMDFVVKFRQNTAGEGFAQMWLNGNLIVDHRGNLGFNTPGYLDYVKFGYYNWSGTNFAPNSPRKVRLRAPTIVADPTGNKYSHADVRSLLDPAGTAAGTSGTTTASSGTTSSGSGLCSTIECAAQ